MNYEQERQLKVQSIAIQISSRHMVYCEMINLLKKVQWDYRGLLWIFQSSLIFETQCSYETPNSNYIRKSINTLISMR